MKSRRCARAQILGGLLAWGSDLRFRKSACAEVVQEAGGEQVAVVGVLREDDRDGDRMDDVRGVKNRIGPWENKKAVGISHEGLLAHCTLLTSR